MSDTERINAELKAQGVKKIRRHDAGDGLFEFGPDRYCVHARKVDGMSAIVVVSGDATPWLDRVLLAAADLRAENERLRAALKEKQG